jgi:predicted acyltransferase
MKTPEENRECLLIWLLINAAGMAAYLIIEYSILAPRPEGLELNSFDVIISFFLFECPVVLLFLMINIVKYNLTIKDQEQKEARNTLRLVLLICVAWGLLIFSHGIGMGILQIVCFVLIHSAMTLFRLLRHSLRF